MNSRRAYDLVRFYELLDRLEDNLGGARRLSECHGRMDWPRLGIYFFRETGENRTDSGAGPRIVRVGTHTSNRGNGSLLWRRLRMHRGNADGSGGNSRGSVFRKIVGAALIERDGYNYPTWGRDDSASKEVTKDERTLEQEVSATLRDMPCLWLATEDEPWSGSQREYIERNAIALLSNYGREPIDPPSADWLGHHSNQERIRLSGLWNSNHVDDDHDSTFLDALQRLIERMGDANHGR